MTQSEAKIASSCRMADVGTPAQRGTSQCPTRVCLHRRFQRIHPEFLSFPVENNADSLEIVKGWLQNALLIKR